MLRDYTQRYSFDVTISYHAMGSVLYYEYGKKSNANTQGLSLANAVNGVTGYPLLDSDGVDGAGYKDWAIAEKNIPSLTIEIGSQDTPLVKRELYSVLVRNLEVFPTIVQWIRK